MRRLFRVWYVIALVVMVAGPSAARLAAQETSPVDLPSPLDEFVAAWNAQDPDRIAALFTDDAVVEEMALGHQVHRGPDEIAAWTAGNFAGIPDLRATPRAAFAADDRLVMEWTYTGHYTGHFESLGVPPGTGQTVELLGVGIFEMRDGKIAHLRLYFDRATFLAQVGLLPLPDAAPVARAGTEGSSGTSVRSRCHAGTASCLLP